MCFSAFYINAMSLVFRGGGLYLHGPYISTSNRTDIHAENGKYIPYGLKFSRVKISRFGDFPLKRIFVIKFYGFMKLSTYTLIIL